MNQSNVVSNEDEKLGIENILRCIRIDYVRRFTYTDGLSGRDRGGIRIGFRLTI